MHIDPVPAAFVGAILTSVRAFDATRVGAVLDEASAAHGLDTTIDEVVFPALRLVGTFWAGGTMDVAHEHLLSVAVARWVAGKDAFQPGVSRQGTILLAAGPQDLHTLGLDCLELLLVSRGVEVCNLGAQTPAASLLTAATSLRPAAVVLYSQSPTVASEAVHSVKALAEAGFPVYLAGSSFVLQQVRQDAPGIALDATLRESAEVLTARHTTPLPAAPATAPGMGVAAVVARAVTVARAATVARAVAVAREVQAVEAALSVTSTHGAVEAAATSAALAEARARARRAMAARSAADVVASNAGLAAAVVQRQADETASTVREAAARAATIVATHPPADDREAALAASRLAAVTHAAALGAARRTAATAVGVATTVALEAARIARTVAELDAAIESEVAATAAEVQATAAATARRVAAATAVRAADIAVVASDAVMAATGDEAGPLPGTHGTSYDGRGGQRAERLLLG